MLDVERWTFFRIKPRIAFQDSMDSIRVLAADEFRKVIDNWSSA